MKTALWIWGLLVVLTGLACEDDDGSGGLLEPDVPIRVRDRGTVTPPTDAGQGDDALGADLGQGDGAADPDLGAVDDAGPAPDGETLDVALLDVDPLAPDADPLAPDAAEPDAAEPDAAPPDAGEDEPSPACLAALDAARFDFEAGAQGFTHQALDGFAGDGSWRFDHWEHGRARSGPGDCADGVGCFATNLTGNYIQCQRAELRSPALDLRACAGHDVLMVFDHWYDFWAGSVRGVDWYDGGTVEIAAAGAGFAVLAGHRYPGVIAINPSLGQDYSCLDGDDFHVHGRPGFTLASEGWQTARLPLDGQHDGAPFQVRFAYATGVSQQTRDQGESERLNPPGWYLDNVRFELR